MRKRTLQSEQLSQRQFLCSRYEGFHARVAFAVLTISTLQISFFGLFSDDKDIRYNRDYGIFSIYILIQ